MVPAALSCPNLPRALSQVMIADGQVSMGDVVFKSNVQKVRRFGSTAEKEGQIVAGFAGARIYRLAGTGKCFTRSTAQPACSLNRR
jgi:ATP-dependent protease HslVU (ClpYQ) peptidase subunit